MKGKITAVLQAILAAALYAIHVPFSGVLLQYTDPTMLAGLLYLGAGAGMLILMAGKQFCGKLRRDRFLTKADLPYTVAMVVLDIAAPILLMYGVKLTTPASVSLLNNMEIVFTALIALLVFCERITARLWVAIGLVTVAGIVLSYEGGSALALNGGALCVMGACLCWGIENNCTRSISDKSSEQIVVIKGLGSGGGGVVVALLLGERFPAPAVLAVILLLGFVAYGLSIDLYIMAQSSLGAAKTSAFYSVAPFLGVGFSFLLAGEAAPGWRFYIGLILMSVATVLMIRDTLLSESRKGEGL